MVRGKRDRARRRPVAVDLFAGSGGLTLGLRRAGFRVAGAIENDPLAVETYERHNRRTVVWSEDIRNVSVESLRRRLGLRRGALDLLAGCPPCQSFSVIRTKNGGRIVRNRRQKDLLLEFIRFVRILRPLAIMMENVPGLTGDRRLTYLRRAFARLGYVSDYRVLDAADYGVPQRRRRIILLAGRYGIPSFAAPTSLRSTVRDAIGHLPKPGQSGDPLHDICERRSAKVARLIRMVPKNGGSRGDLPARRQLACHRRVRGFHDVYGRMAWDAVAPTITSGFVNPSKGRFLHPQQDRTVTLREAALLQTFPPKYAFDISRGKFEAAALIGNALPPRFIEQLARPLARYVCSATARERRSD